MNYLKNHKLSVWLPIYVAFCVILMTLFFDLLIIRFSRNYESSIIQSTSLITSEISKDISNNLNNLKTHNDTLVRTFVQSLEFAKIEQSNLSYVIDKTANMLVNENAAIKNQLFYFDNEYLFFAPNLTSNHQKSVIDFLNSEYPMSNNPTHSFFTAPIPLGGNDYCFAYVSPVVSEHLTPDTYWITLYDYDVLTSVFSNIKVASNDAFALLLSDDKIVADNTRLALNEIPLRNLIRHSNDSTITLNDEKYLYQQYLNITPHLSLYTFVPQSIIADQLHHMIFTSNMLFALLVVLFIVLGIKMVSSIKQPMNQIIHHLDTADTSNITDNLTIEGHNEFTVIAEHINTFIANIQDSEKELSKNLMKIHQLELEKKESELKFYRNQINPHFLYNTLECIRSMSIAYEAPEIENITVSMSKLFRYSVNNKDLVSIEDEIGCAKEYLNIMSLRFPDQFNYQFDVAEQYLSLPIIKMLFQPLIENVFKHAFNNLDRKGAIHISITDNGRELLITVKDNGNGISKENLDRLNRDLASIQDRNDGKNLGIVNINNRIKLTYGNSYGLFYESQPSAYTLVSINIPFPTVESEEI